MIRPEDRRAIIRHPPRRGLATARRIGDRSWIFNFREKVEQALWLIGAWDECLDEAAAGLEEGPEPGDRQSFLNAVIRMRALRGEPVAQNLDELSRTADLVTDPQTLWTTVEEPAFASFGEGNLAEAGESWRVGAPRFGLKAHSWLYRAAETAIRLRDADTASADLAALDALGLHGPLIEHRRASIEAGRAALAGHLEEAARLYDVTLRGFRELGAPLDESLATLDMAILLDPADADVRAAAEAGRDSLVRLRAAPLLALLDAALAGQTEVAQGPRQTAPGRTLLG